MRTRVIVAALGVGIAWTAPAAAQSPLDGPLAAPDAAPVAAPKAHAKAKTKKPRRVVATPAAVPDAAARSVPAAAAVPTRHETPPDPLDLGMKWSGSNDTAAQTRYQNGPSNAFGSGAEVGMKLHF